MTCKDILERLQDYLDGDLKEKYFREIENHLASCSSCREEYNSLKQISELFRQERIRLPNEEHWQKTWKTIEGQIIAPKISWYRELWVQVDTYAMRIFNPQSLALRVSFSMGLFFLGIVFGASYLAPSGIVSQQVFKVEHKVKEVPVVQKEEVVRYLQKEVVKPEIREKVVEKPNVIYLASKPIELAPVFPANDATELKSDSADLWNGKLIVDKQIQKIQQELAPTFNQTDNSGPTVRTVNMTGQ